MSGRSLHIELFECKLYKNSIKIQLLCYCNAVRPTLDSVSGSNRARHAKSEVARYWRWLRLLYQMRGAPQERCLDGHATHSALATPASVSNFERWKANEGSRRSTSLTIQICVSTLEHIAAERHVILHWQSVVHLVLEAGTQYVFGSCKRVCRTLPRIRVYLLIANQIPTPISVRIPRIPVAAVSRNDDELGRWWVGGGWVRRATGWHLEAPPKCHCLPTKQWPAGVWQYYCVAWWPTGTSSTTTDQFHCY